MNLVYLAFITFNVILQCKFISSNYLQSESNLLEVLNSYINEREVYLKKITRYVDAIEKSHNATKNMVCPEKSDNYLRISWKQYQVLKRITIDWQNFLNVLKNDTYLSDKIKKAIAEANKGSYSEHWILRENDYRLIHVVINLMNAPQTLSIKSNEQRQILEKKLKEKIKLKLQKLKESLKEFVEIAEYTPHQYPYWDDYAKLCRSEVFLNQNNLNLKCKYVHNNKPYLFIGPLKQEELYLDPQIFMYHDVLPDSEITKIHKFSSQEKMSISQGEETVYRVAKVTWLFSQKMNHLIGLMTNLTMTSAELLQLSVYGLAGQYEPHYDSGLDENDPTHSRISTVIFYLNDVTKGGNTVFPILKLAVPPKKGAAIFWYNILPNYEVDTRTLHAGCPLYSGIKWVMNSWVQRSGQEFAKPCMKEHKESFVY